MSKYGFKGGFRREAFPEPRGDPVGPSLEELIRAERAQKSRQNFDPRFGGGPVFRPINVPKRRIFNRYPRLFSAAFILSYISVVVIGPFCYQKYKGPKPLTEQEKIDNKIYNDRVSKYAKNSVFPDIFPRLTED